MTPDKIAANTASLASLPRAYHRIDEMLADARYGPADIGRVIRHEPTLTARLLRMANSAYFGVAMRIDTVPLAISVLGTKALHELVLATCVASAFTRIDTRLVDVADFWHHSVYCGIMARLLSKRLRIAESEQIFVAGLLHDIGKLAIYHQLPEQTEHVLSRFADSGAPLYEVEPGHKITRSHDTLPSFDPATQPRLALTPTMAEELAIDADLQSIEVYATLFGNSPPLGD